MSGLSLGHHTGVGISAIETVVSARAICSGMLDQLGPEKSGYSSQHLKGGDGSGANSGSNVPITGTMWHKHLAGSDQLCYSIFLHRQANKFVLQIKKGVEYHFEGLHCGQRQHSSQLTQPREQYSTGILPKRNPQYL
jgi:hypothetical protein